MPSKSGNKTVDTKRKRKSTVKDLPLRPRRGETVDSVKGGRIRPKRADCDPAT